MLFLPVKYRLSKYTSRAILVKCSKRLKALEVAQTYKNKPITTIEDRAFYRCAKLTSLTLPASISRIGWKSFYGCKQLKNVYYLGNLQSWCQMTYHDPFEPDMPFQSGIEAYQYAMIYDDFYKDNCANPLSYGANLYIDNVLITDLVLPDSLSKICEYAFRGCGSLNRVRIPTSVKMIDRYAFYGCCNLTEIAFDGSMDEWKAVQKGGSWHTNSPVKVVICRDGEVSL